MPLKPVFARNRCTSVEQIDESTIRSTCRLQDTLTEAWVELMVKLPDLEVVEASASFARSPREECRDADQAAQKAVGVRIGPGMLKIIKGLMAEVTSCGQLGFMVEECCHGVILAFTKETLMATPEDQINDPATYREMVRNNIRLFNRCAAFAPGSSMVEGLEPPQ